MDNTINDATADIDVNRQDEYGRTALHFSAFVGNLDICKLLIRNNAETEAKTKDGKSITTCAADANQTGATSFMIR